VAQHRLLEDYADKLDDDGKQYLAYVRESAQHMSQLIDDMLALSQVTRGDFERASVDLTRIARSVDAELRRVNPNRQVVFLVPDGLIAEGDTRLMTIAFENLLGNAWKYSGGREQARIEVGAIDGDPRTFFVRDNGAGFDMAYADKLFAIFIFRYDEAPYDRTKSRVHERFMQALNTFGMGKGLVVPIGGPKNLPTCVWLGARILTWMRVQNKQSN
jgi:light-regulated signal transduction histidine kinase (bacteriophytochrome)